MVYKIIMMVLNTSTIFTVGVTHPSISHGHERDLFTPPFILLIVKHPVSVFVLYRIRVWGLH